MYPNLFLYIFVLIAIFTLFFDILKGASKKAYIGTFIATYVFLALLVAFRYGTGPDTPRYMYAFQVMPDLHEIKFRDFGLYRAQPGFILLVAFVKTVFVDFVYLQIIQATLYFTSFYLLLKRFELRKFYILLVFYSYVYFAALSGIRECLGLSFCFFALLYYFDYKYTKFYILVFVGFMLHSGMIIFFLLPFVRYFKTLRFENILLILFVFLLAILSLTSVRQLLYSLNEGSLARSAHASGEGISLPLFVVGFSYLLLFYFYCFKLNRHEKHIDVIYMGIVYVIISLFTGIIPILYRFTSHLAIFFYYCINLTFTRMKRDSIWRFYLILLFFYTPLVRFNSLIDRPNYAYCSVFSSEYEKSEYDKIIRDAWSSDLYTD